MLPERKRTESDGVSEERGKRTRNKHLSSKSVKFKIMPPYICRVMEFKRHLYLKYQLGIHKIYEKYSIFVGDALNEATINQNEMNAEWLRIFVRKVTQNEGKLPVTGTESKTT